MKFGHGRSNSIALVLGGRYGLSSKEFTPAMVESCVRQLWNRGQKDHFTVGINDDVSHSSLNYDPDFSIEPEMSYARCSMASARMAPWERTRIPSKIIGENTGNYAQGYFVYDSKKSGAMTVSHLRFGPKPIHSAYLISKANFVACHQWIFLERYDMLVRSLKAACSC